MKKTLKRILAIMLVVVMTIGMAPLSGFVGLELPEFGGFKKLANSVSDFFEGFGTKAEAATEYTSSGFRYYLESDKTIRISGIDYSASISGELIIPAQIDGYQVSEIGQASFYNNDKITDIIISEGIEKVRSGAFSCMKNLRSVSFPDSLVYWEYSLFSHCPNLTSVNIPKLVTDIPSQMFNKCSSLKKVSIGDNITSIQASAFLDCISLEEINIPDSVNSIGNNAFEGCSKLKNIVLSGKITNLGYSVFADCDSLESVVYPDFVTCGTGLFNCCDNLKNVVFPEGITKIEASAFQDCISLNNVIFPESLLSINDYAFKGCKSLSSITIPSKVLDIGLCVFRECVSLENITVNKGNVNYFSDDYGVLFSEKELIQYPSGTKNISYIIPSNVEIIGDYAFSYCENLKYVAVSSSVKTIGDHGFYECTNLEKIKLSKNLNSIYRNAFVSCDNLADIYFTGNEEEWSLIKKHNPYYSALATATIHYNYNYDEPLAVEIKSEFDNYRYINGLFCSGTGVKYEQIPITVSVTNISDDFKSAISNDTDVFTIKNININLDLQDTGEIKNGANSVYINSLKLGDTKEFTYMVSPHIEDYLISTVRIIVSVSADNVKTQEVIGESVTLSYALNPATEMFGFNNATENFVGKYEPNIYNISLEAILSTSYLVHSGSFSKIIYLANSLFNEGSCYGMSAMTVGFRNGWISPMDFGSSQVSQLVVPVNSNTDEVLNSKLRDAINIMQLSQLASKYINKVIIPNSLKSDTEIGKELVEAVKDIQNGGCLPVVKIKEYDSKAGKINHFVVAFDIVEQGNNYVISVMDPNFAQEPRKITISKDYSEIKYDKNKLVDIIYSITDRSVLDLNYFSSGFRTQTVESEYKFTAIALTDFDLVKIENTSGKYATISSDEGKIDGNLNVLIDTVAGGGTDIVQVIIMEEATDPREYKIKSNEKGMRAIIDSQEMISDVNVSGEAEAFYSASGLVVLDNFTDSKFSVSLADNSNNDIFLNSISGNKAGKAELKLDRDSFEILTDNPQNTRVTIVKNDDSLTEKTFEMKSPVAVVKSDESGKITIVNTEVAIHNPSTTTINYGDSIWLHAEISGELPADAKIIWTPSNNNFEIVEVSADGLSCKITPKSNGTTTFTVSVVDANEKVFSTDTQNMNAKAGLWQKIVAFFKKLFGATKTYPEVFKSLF